jgi:dienelactone hydrolase
VAQDHATPFAAAVAFYPGCQRPDSALATDTLILIGSADDWTPAANCIRWSKAVQTAGHMLHIMVYTGALHSFDAPAMPHLYAGHETGRDPAAAANSFVVTQQFLAQHLSQ